MIHRIKGDYSSLFPNDDETCAKEEGTDDDAEKARNASQTGVAAFIPPPCFDRPTNQP